jgi:hypothetical protein
MNYDLNKVPKSETMQDNFYSSEKPSTHLSGLCRLANFITTRKYLLIYPDYKFLAIGWHHESVK